MNCSPLGSSVHRISQTRVLEWVAISSSRGSSRPSAQIHITCISCLTGRFFITEPPGNTDCLVAVCWLSYSEARGIPVPQPGIYPTSPPLQGGFLTTGPPGKSLPHCIFTPNSLHWLLFLPGLAVWLASRLFDGLMGVVRKGGSYHMGPWEWKWSRRVTLWTLCDSSVHGILQARILEWVAISFSRGSSRDRTQVSGNASRLFTVWATKEFYYESLNVRLKK